MIDLEIFDWFQTLIIIEHKNLQCKSNYLKIWYWQLHVYLVMENIAGIWLERVGWITSHAQSLSKWEISNRYTLALLWTSPWKKVHLECWYTNRLGILKIGCRIRHVCRIRHEWKTPFFPKFLHFCLSEKEFSRSLIVQKTDWTCRSWLYYISPWSITITILEPKYCKSCIGQIIFTPVFSCTHNKVFLPPLINLMYVSFCFRLVERFLMDG